MSWWELLAAAGRAGRGAVGGWALAKWAPGGEGGGVLVGPSCVTPTPTTCLSGAARPKKSVER